VQGALALSGGNVGFTGTATIAAGGAISGNGALVTGGLTNSGTLAFATQGGAALDPSRPVDVSTVNGFVVTTAGGQVSIGAKQNVTFNDIVAIRSGATLSIAGGSTATFLGSVNQVRGATFSGEGSKTYAGGFTVDNLPALGTDAGDVTFAATNRYDARIGGTSLGDALGNGIGFARYVVTGKLTFGGTLRVSDLKGYAPQAGNSYDLFDWGTSEGSFSTIDFTAAPLANGLAWDTSRLYTDGTLTVAAVPEPGSYAMFAAGLGLMGFMVRRRRSARPA
jgi:hypothetical protein